jgi:hypothetical protein
MNTNMKGVFIKLEYKKETVPPSQTLMNMPGNVESDITEEENAHQRTTTTYRKSENYIKTSFVRDGLVFLFSLT